MSLQTPRKALFAIALIALPILPRGAEARPRHRTRPPVSQGGPAATSSWRGLLAFLGLADLTPPPPNPTPQVGCDIDPDGKCKTATPPTP